MKFDDLIKNISSFSPSEEYKGGTTLSSPREKPFEPEDRHKFSTKEHQFDQIIGNFRLCYSCRPEFRHEIDTVAWLTVADGNPSYSRKFINTTLNQAEFRWLWLDHCIEQFHLWGDFPEYWKKSWDVTKLVPAQIAWEEWLGCVKKMAYFARDIDTQRNYVNMFRHKKYQLVAWPDSGCRISRQMLDKRNLSITASIAAGDLESVFPAYPTDGSYLRIFRRP